jgi:hypothetical protein
VAVEATFLALFLLGFAEADARSTAVLVDEFDAGRFQGTPISIPADCLYQHLLLTAEKKFRRCVESGESPRLLGAEPPRPRIAAVRIVDMSASNSWAELAGVFCQTRAAFLDHEQAKTELKILMPEDAKEAFGHGTRLTKTLSRHVGNELATGADEAEARDKRCTGNFYNRPEKLGEYINDQTH